MGGSRGHQRGDGGLHLRAVDRELRAAPRLRPVHSPEVGGEPRSLRGGAPQRAAQQALIVLWGGVIPALLAGLALRYLVPRAATVGLPGMVTVLGHRFGTYFAVALFFLFRALVGHWRYWMPGGRYASALPAQLVSREKNGDRLAKWADDAALYEQLRSGSLRRRLERTLDARAKAELDRHLVEMREGLEAGDADRTSAARRAAEELAAPSRAWKRRREALGLLASVGLTGVAVLLLRARVVEPYQVQSTSMLPTLEQDDH